ncbi:MAG: hypothetical protein KBS66_07550 [Eubacterium sp.]|nr:hypothetical protein [Candidatus Colimonas fimequi]
MNKALFMACLVKHGDTQKSLADALGLSLSRLNAKINARDGADFTQTEMQCIIDRYKLGPMDTAEIFFDH